MTIGQNRDVTKSVCVLSRSHAGINIKKNEIVKYIIIPYCISRD